MGRLRPGSIHLDALGSVRVVTKGNGTEDAHDDFLPFGEEYNGSSTGLLFTSKMRDGESGLDYFGARYYSAQIGRFTTIDPVYNWNENLQDPQRWNRYAYVRDNPLRFLDPDGRAPQDPRVAAIIYNETSGLRPTGATAKGSASDLHEARVWIAHVVQNGGSFQGLDRLTSQERKDIKRNPDAKAAWEDACTAAAEAAEAKSDPTGGAKYAVQNNGVSLEGVSWIGNTVVVGSPFGPFQPVGGGDVGTLPTMIEIRKDKPPARPPVKKKREDESM
jgi:RHS repeat-associated protein